MSKGRTQRGGKGRDRTVYRSGADWINKRNDATRASSKHGTQRQAIDAARRC